MNNSRLTLHGAGKDLESKKTGINKQAKILRQNTIHEVTKVLQQAAFYAQGVNLDNELIPTGYTYFGQFIAHDISIQQLALENLSDLPELQNKATLRLDALYGFGPRASAHLYQFHPPHSPCHQYSGVKFRIWHGEDQRGEPLSDCIRLEDGLPVMADARNDENFILSQLHVTFLRYHNIIAERLHVNNPTLRGKKLFDATKKKVIHDYQRVILYDFLPRLVGCNLVKELLHPSAKFSFFTKNKGAILLKAFVDVAFRFGHSQVRNQYKIASPDPLQNVPLFSEQGVDLRGFKRDLARNIEWKFLFQCSNHVVPQFSKRIDHLISTDLMKLPFFGRGNNNLVLRNLKKGQEVNIPLLLAKGGVIPLTREDYERINDAYGIILREYLINDMITCPTDLPPWLYILLEAEIKENGKKLGPLGARIVAEQIIWILKQDKTSILHHKFMSPCDPFSISGLLDTIQN